MMTRAMLLLAMLLVVECDGLPHVYDFPCDHTTPELTMKILDELAPRADLGFIIYDIESPNMGCDMRTILHVAATVGHTEGIRVLLEEGAVVSVRDAKLRTPLHEAAAGGHHLAISKLVAAGASLTAGDVAGDKPLHVAAYHGHEEAVRALVNSCLRQRIATGAWLEAENRAGKTPLYLASTRGHNKAARVLLAAGAVPTSLPSATYYPDLRKRIHLSALWSFFFIWLIIDISEALALFERRPTSAATNAASKRKKSQSSAPITNSELARREREAARKAAAAAEQQVTRIKANEHKQAATAARTLKQASAARESGPASDAALHNVEVSATAPARSHRRHMVRAGVFSTQEALELEAAQLHKALEDSVREAREQAELTAIEAQLLAVRMNASPLPVAECREGGRGRGRDRGAGGQVNRDIAGSPGAVAEASADLAMRLGLAAAPLAPGGTTPTDNYEPVYLGGEQAATTATPTTEPLFVITGGLDADGASPEADRACVVCMHRPQSHIALPCGHLIYCGGCATLMRGKPCALCMHEVSEIKEVFRG